MPRRQIPDRARAIGVHIAGVVASQRGDWDHSAQLHEELAQLARELGDSWLLSVAVNNLGDVALNRGEYERALELFEESLAIGRERQDRDLLARALTNLGFTTLMLGDVQRARSLLRDGLVAAREIGLVEGFIQGFVALGVAYAREDPARAARLIGRADMLLEETASRAPTRREVVFATRRKQSSGRGWGRTPTQRCTRRGARSRSRTRWRSPSAQTELESRFRGCAHSTLVRARRRVAQPRLNRRGAASSEKLVS